MEYTLKEKEILSMIGKTDFKHLSKNDFVSYASKLNELRPEVARMVIAQYPELANMIVSVANEYKGMLDTVMSSDNKSVERVYDVADKEMQMNETSRIEFFDLADKVRQDLSKGLDNPDISEDERNKIREQEMEILRMADKKDKEIRDSETNTLNLVNEKDSEKRKFNWGVLASASTLAMVAVGIGAAALGGKFDIKLPNKK